MTEIKIGPAKGRELPKKLKPARRAVLGWMPYEDPDGSDFPLYAQYSMLGYCHVHLRMEKITSFRGISTGVDNCRVAVMECGHINRDSVF